MRIEETSLNFNITVHLVGDSYEDAKIQIESLPPMGKDEFWSWLLQRAKAGELPRTTRPSREVWRDTKEHPAPKSELERMAKERKEFLRLKKQFPDAPLSQLEAKVKEAVKMKEEARIELQKKLNEILGF